jgi:hypothetical protein
MLRTRTRRPILAAIAILIAALALLPSDASGARAGRQVPGSPHVVVLSGPPAAMRLATWAIGRFERAGLELPPTGIFFHPDDEGCDGNLGVADGGLVDLCVRHAMEPGPQRIVLHELAHVWEAAALDDDCRERFMALRGLERWVGDEVDWKQRGAEQAAEIVAWALGDGTMSPMIDGAREPDALREGFDLLTSCGTA